MIVKTLIMLQKVSISNKCCSLQHIIHQRVLNKCMMVSTKQLMKIKEEMFLEHQHIIMISERSCDTEDWSNDAEKQI